MKSLKLKFLWSCLFSIVAMTGFGQAAPAATENTDYALEYTLVGIAFLLLIVIVILANSLKAASDIYAEKKGIKKNSVVKTIILFIVSFVATSGLSAQEAAPAVAAATGGYSTTVYIFISFIFFEFVLILALIQMLYKILDLKQAAKALAPVKQEKSLFESLNETVAIEDEDSLDLMHNYDGIRELDNKVPAWWLAAFYASILFGGIYMYRMFVAETLPLQTQELMAENETAEIQKLAYLKNNVSEVDENTVRMLSGADLGEGAALFTANCSACHGDKGQGNTVGPNLTDAYWIHKGGIKNIFYSIKYGWAEKGMKSWKNDFNSMQIAQLASYVQSIQGSNPPGAKEPQGELYKEEVETTLADSAVVIK